MDIPYNRPALGPDERRAVRNALLASALGGNGSVGRSVQALLAELTGAKHVLLTPNATQAMEIALMATGIGPGDEVLMPSFAFVSQANVILARGARPVFCDVDPATLNMDPEDAARRITARTKLVFPVHYAGISADLTAFKRLAKEHGLLLFEDAAQCIGSRWGQAHLGTVGDAGCLSFHETKNLGCGEGGALLLRDAELARACEIIQEKGTNRSAFLRGEVDKYTWVGPGGSYVLSDLLAALLGAQLARAVELTAERVAQWEAYHAAFEELEALGLVRRPHVPRRATHNGHIYALRAATPELQQRVLARLHAQGIGASFHFQPLHSSPYARRHLAVRQDLPHTTAAAETILRLPLWSGLGERRLERVTRAVYAAFLDE